MENRTDINNELASISPMLARLLPVNPYHVPLGYFDELPPQILRYSATPAGDDLTLSAGLIPVPYKAPDSYFESFAATVLERLQRDNGVTAVLPFNAVTPYQVHPDYFSGLADQLMSRIRALEADTHSEELEILSPLLGNLNKPVPFVLPEGYFNDFASDLVDGVQAVDFVNAELEEHSPIMTSARFKNVYDVPAGYFETLADNVSGKVRKSRTPAGLLRAIGTKTFRFAAAAVIAGAISLGVLYFFQGSQPGSVAAGSLSGIEKISSEEMASYLETTPVSDPNTESFDLQETDVKEMLAGVSDKELEDYLSRDLSAKDLNN